MPITYRYVQNQAIWVPTGLRLQSPGGVLKQFKESGKGTFFQMHREEVLCNIK